MRTTLLVLAAATLVGCASPDPFVGDDPDEPACGAAGERFGYATPVYLWCAAEPCDEATPWDAGGLAVLVGCFSDSARAWQSMLVGYPWLVYDPVYSTESARVVPDACAGSATCSGPAGQSSRYCNACPLRLFCDDIDGAPTPACPSGTRVRVLAFGEPAPFCTAEGICN